MSVAIYQSRGRTYCGASGSRPSLSTEVIAQRYVKCSECGRTVMITMYGLISHHGPAKK